VTASPHQTRLYLNLTIAEGALERLRAALDAAPVEAVLMRAPGRAGIDARAVKPLVEAARAKGVAALVAQDARLARQTGADGVHLDWSADIEDDYRAARALLGQNMIVGASAGSSRHDAMTLAEAGADYIAFKIEAQDRAASVDTVAWWAEIFEVPCVALGNADVALALEVAEAGADFLGVTIPAGQSPHDTAQQLRAVDAALQDAPTDGGGS
jgi:thiamine-phosphate pyrophosphorylase